MYEQRIQLTKKSFLLYFAMILGEKIKESVVRVQLKNTIKVQLIRVILNQTYVLTNRIFVTHA